jgi:hypothetical protein
MAPADGWLCFSLGYGLMRLGLLADAGHEFSQAQRLGTGQGDDRLISGSWNGTGDVLVAQGDGPGALGAYQAGLTIREGLAKRDPANTQWQLDVVVSCAKLGSLDSLLTIQQRREYLSRGLNLITALKQVGQLHANQDGSGWFDNALSSLK